MSAERSAAFDRIDRFLRGNLDDTEYAPYAEALDVLWSPTPARGSAVWVVRDALDEVQAAFPTEKAAVRWMHRWIGDGLLHVTRETLLTPAQAAVLAAAKALESLIDDHGYQSGGPVTIAGLRVVIDDTLPPDTITLRAQEGE